MKEFFKKIGAKLRNPPKSALVGNYLLTLVCVAVSLTMVFLGYTGVFSYVAYIFAALTLAYTVYTIVLYAPAFKGWVLRALRRREFTKNLTEDYSFRTVVFATCSFVVNLAFVAFNTVFAVLTKNAWYASLAGYYFLLSGLRGGVFWKNRRAKASSETDEEYQLRQLKNYRWCGVALFSLDFAMAVAVTVMVVQNRPTKYTEIMAIVFAAYACYKIALAVRNIFKAKKTKDVFIQSFRNVGLVDAAISLLSLQVTLVGTFSKEGGSMLLLNALTGAFVCLLTISVGVAMIVQANRKIKERRKREYE